MFNKSTAIIYAVIGSAITDKLVVGQEFNYQDEHATYSGEYANGQDGRSLKAQIESVDASGIFGLFDVNGDGSIQPAEITQAYNAMNTKDNDNLKQNELLKAMDGQIRNFCGVGPATEAEIQAEQENQGIDEDQKPRDKRNNRNRNKNQRDNRQARNRRGREDDFDDQDEIEEQPDNLGMTYGDEQDFDQEEDEFEDDGNGGRRLRSRARGGNSQRGTWNNNNAKNNRNFKNRNNRSSRNQRNQREGNKKRGGKVSRKSLAKKRMAKGLFGILDANHNKNISLKEMFRPFSSADTDFNYNVSLAEFNQFISKRKNSICKPYKIKARKSAQKTWYEMGVPEEDREDKKRGRN